MGEGNRRRDGKSMNGIQQKKGVIHLEDFRQQKLSDHELARGRKPLYVSHGMMDLRENSGSPGEGSPGINFGERLQKLRKSLDKMTSLLGDLKKLPESGGH